MNETALTQKNNEISYKNYRTLKQLKNTELKGFLRWFLCSMAFFIPDIFLRLETSFSNGIKAVIMIYFFIKLYEQFDTFANSPNFVSTAPASRKKIVKYDMISLFVECISELILFTAIFSTLVFIFGDKKDFIKLTEITKGDIFSWILPFIFLFLIYPLSYVKSRKRFYIQAGITTGIYIGITFLLTQIVYYSPNFIDCEGNTNITKNFHNIPHSDIVFVVSIVLLVLSIVSAYFLSVRNAEKR